MIRHKLIKLMINPKKKTHKQDTSHDQLQPFRSKQYVTKRNDAGQNIRL